MGTYEVEVTFAGFKSAARTGIVVNVADVREVNVQLSTGEISETVSVEDSAYSVKTVGAEVAGLVSGDQVRELPLNGRNFLQLTLLQPGVTPTEGLNTVNKGLLGGADISVSGGSTTSNMWLVDGADNVDHGSNRTILVYPSVDAIEEFKIQRNNYGAEFGQAGGAQVNVVTRGGTNTFHGSAYYFARRDSWNSTDYFLKQAGLPGAPLHVGRLRRDLRRADRQGQAALLPLLREEHGPSQRRAQRVRAHRGREGWGLQRGASRRLHTSGPGRSAHGPGVPRERDPRRPHQPGRARVSQALPGPEQHAELGVQQLRPGRAHAHRLGPDQRPGGLEHQQQHPRDGSLHPGQLEGRRHAPGGRLANVGRRVGLGPAEPVARGPAQSDLRVEHDEHPDVLVLGQRDHRRPDRGRSRGRPGQRRVAHDLPRRA